MQSARPRLGQLLVEANILTPEQLEGVLALQRSDPRKLGQLLVESGLVSETRITQLLSQQLSVPWVSLYHIDFSRELLALVPRDLAELVGLIPIYVRAVRGQGDTLYVAMEDPMNEDALRECARCSGLPTRAMIAAPSEIRRAIRIYYGASDSFRAARAASSAPESPAAKQVARPPAADSPTKQQAARAHARGSKSAMSAAAADPARPEGSSLKTPPEAAVEQSGRGPAAATAVSNRALEPATESPVVTPTDEGPTVEVREIDLGQIARRRRQRELTLLDGTTLRLPSAGRGAKSSSDGPSGEDIVAALRAVAAGSDAGDALGKQVRWEKMLAAVLDLLLRKHLILERELIDALKK